MKQFLLSLALALATFLGINAQAKAQTTKTYTDYLTVAIEELDFKTEPQEASVDVIFNTDGTMDLTLKNFVLMMGDGVPVGNIAVTNLDLKNSKYRSYKTFCRADTIMLEDGDLSLYPEWLAPQLNDLGGVPIDLKGQINDEHLFVTIDIYMEALGQTIKVEVGEPLTDVKPDNCKEYTLDLTVAIEELSFKTEPQPATVLVFYNEDGTMDLTLTNFILMMGDGVPVGNIAVSNLALTPSQFGAYNTFERTETIMLEDGDLDLYPEWLASQLNELGGVPIILEGQIDDEKLYVTIDIYMEALGQTIKVEVGEPWEEEVPSTFTLTFNIDGETVSTQEFEVGAAIVAPEVEAREGYTLYWRNEIPETMPAENLTINGEYVINTYWVTFSIDGTAIYQELQEYGSEITVPEVEEREGYTFAWDQEIPEIVPTDNVTINGTYTVNQYTITWILNGEEYAQQTLDFGAEIVAPEVTGDERYSFGGWEAVPETMPAHDVVINGSLVDDVASMKTNVIGAQYGYNLAGMRVNVKNARGIFIVNGKKVLKK